MRVIALVFVLAFGLFPVPAQATFSIAACDGEGNCGVAVATHNLAVGGSRVAWARARVGAVASQFETHPGHGPRALALLSAGLGPAKVLQRLLAEDGGFEGGSIDDRQIGLVDARGRQAQHTGRNAARADWAGALGTGAMSLQGNGLAGPQVLAAMRERFEHSQGPLAERLLAALEAGQAAGGQATGQWSAALKVSTIEGGWQDTDLRVDAAPDAVRQLRRLHDMQQARGWMSRAERLQRTGHAERARGACDRALALGAEWDRMWVRAARLAMDQQQPVLAAERLERLRTLNPGWLHLLLKQAPFAALLDDARVRERLLQAQ
ncbi:DUF1028 domain-containing protein [Cystobacter ferrugineus]|uniref:DUF1028 domain-containing protein n=1 Tax=Cystobacter ferrugineus TaxID=83449 RepID=A0A1L9BIP7_9BACT|nr:DUF1028 domain-containing protein [Cystobacter ferrugineus]OJH42109.1 hypothetical protein BON30_02495 [Cystobacter ferrugineus]